MPTYAVHLHLGFDRRPSREEQAFLGPLRARAQPWGSVGLLVSLDVRAADATAALADAHERVVRPLGGEIESVRVARSGPLVGQTSWWRRWRRRAP